MNVEQRRLETFTGWPPEAVVSPTRIARAGFYSTGQDLTVECFACGCRISEWNYGDQVMARHRLLNPQCPFVLNPATSGNVPNVPASSPAAAAPSTLGGGSGTTSAGDGDSMKTEEMRLATFVEWPVTNIVTPEQLAKAGFYSLHHQDKVKCAYCKGVVGCWEVGDDPDREHWRHFPRCPFVMSTIVPRLNPVQSILSNLNVMERSETDGIDLQALGLQTHTVPRHAKYTTFESRIRSFVGWPEDLVQTPDMLAQSGFYYVGGGDQVRCFHCDGGLRHWDPEDDPWVEHARWFPECAFVQTVKGTEFVRDCQRASEERNRSAPFSRVREVSDREIQALMVTPQVVAALNVGLHVGRVKKALRYKMEQTGTAFSSADALIEAALNEQLEEDGAPENHRVAEQVGEMLSQALRDASNESVTASTVPSAVNGSVNDFSNAMEEVNMTNKTEGEIRKAGLSLEEENRLLKEARLCKICMDSEVGIVFLPCGHLATCVTCAPSLQACPVCRCSIKATVRTFLS